MYEEECKRIPEVPQIIDKISPLQRPIEPDEVASACLYLCSPRAVALNGVTLTMDTGFTAGPMIA